MKALLWFVLAIAVSVNVSTNFVFDGALQIAASVGTGVVTILAGVGLWLLHARGSER